MLYLKSNRNLSKYANEIMRLLDHQICILSEKEAHEKFYGMFVNTSGKYDSHISTDRCMEYLVKDWLVGCFGFNGPLRQYFSLYRAVSQREGERKEKR